MASSQLRSERREVDDALAAIDYYFDKGWTDGLPVVPPTEPSILEFLRHIGMGPDEIVGTVPARRRVVTAEKLAINAVMAGCKPEYMPVVLAAFQAMCDEAYNIHGTSVTTGGPAPLVIVNGPIARRLEINGNTDLFGPGRRANATIGRAMRLLLINACGTVPGVMDKSIIGHPGKYSFCIAEDEEDDSPWEPLHVMRGLDPNQSAVTMFACDAPKQCICDSTRGPEEALASVAASVLDPGAIGVPGWPTEFLVVIPPVHRRLLQKAGWSKRDVQNYLYEHTMITGAMYEQARRHPMEREGIDWSKAQPSVEKPEDFLVIAGGGDGGIFCALLPPWWGRVSRSVTRPVVEVVNRRETA